MAGPIVGGAGNIGFAAVVCGLVAGLFVIMA
jgi:hypothetical protein